uniref:DAZ-associated protein 1 n=2 Tax=Bos indicus x Bos taurus TaxID=30522 RepID=A0A4W2HH72_BOBOX
MHTRSQHAHARGLARAPPPRGGIGAGARDSTSQCAPRRRSQPLRKKAEARRPNGGGAGPAARTHARTRVHPWPRPRRPRAGARSGVRRAAARARGRAVTVGAEGRRQRGRRRCADPGRGCGEGAGASDLPEAGASQGARTPSAAAAAMNNSGADEIGKLFVGGLDWSTTQETLRSYFSQYGEVVDCVIMKDKTTNQSRGFGFVKFKDPNCVGTVLASRPHTLDGRNIDPKPCTPRGMQPERTRPKEGWQKGPRSDNSKSNKIFVGGIPHNCGETELREYFKKFGVVTEVVMIYDAEKQRPRGFGFITFEDEQSVDQAVNMHFHDIMGKKVEVKRAEPRDSKSQAPGQPGASQWGSRVVPNAANGWAGQPPPTWQQGYGPQGKEPALGRRTPWVPALLADSLPVGCPWSCSDVFALHLRCECGCRQDRRSVAMDRPPQEEEPPRRPHPSPPTLCLPLLEASRLPRASPRATARPHSSVLATDLHLPHQISLPLQGFPHHRPLPGPHLWPSHHLHLRLPQT